MKSKLNFSVPVQLADRLTKLIPRGMRSEILRISLTMALDFVEKGKSPALGMILNEDVKFAMTESGERSVQNLNETSKIK